MGAISAARFFKYVYGPLVLLILLSSLASGFSRRAYNGIMQDYSPGWKYVYYSATDTESWVHNSNWCFTFKYDASGSNGTWKDVDKFGTLRSVAYDNYTKLPWEVSVNAGNGWLYSYSSGDWGYWSKGSAQRFGYAYGAGQWFDSDKFNTWRGLGAANTSANRMFDGNNHSLGDGWSYYYRGYYWSQDAAQWANGSSWRFGYDYGTGQWTDVDKIGTWRSLGVNVAAARPWVASVNMNNGWSYYYSPGDWGYWITGSSWRLGYSYAAGQWFDDDKFGTWRSLGDVNVAAARPWVDSVNMNNGWSYCYSPGGWGYWITGSSWRFGYAYDAGQWMNAMNGASSVGWQTLGPGSMTRVFLGDGTWHTLDGLWSYKYVNGDGYLQGSVWQYTCNYGYQVFGLYDSGNIASVFRYDVNGGSSYKAKWENWNFSISSPSCISQAIVFYTGSTYHDVSTWLGWLPVNPQLGSITRTETWDYSNNDYSNRYNHEVRAFSNSNPNAWLVQRQQGDIGNCGIIASIDSYEARTGRYVGQTQAWQETAYLNGWCDSTGGTYNWQQAALMAHMGDLFGSPVSTTYGTNTGRTLDNLVSLVNAGGKVIVGVDLHYISEFGYFSPSEPAGHAIALLGKITIGSVDYAEITNGWSIKTNTTQIAGYDPKQAYPITYIRWSELLNAYRSYSRIQ